jgi:hypothetical protein
MKKILIPSALFFVFAAAAQTGPFEGKIERGVNVGGTNSVFRTSKGNSVKEARLKDPSVCGNPLLNCPD